MVLSYTSDCDDEFSVFGGGYYVQKIFLLDDYLLFLITSFIMLQTSL